MTRTNLDKLIDWYQQEFNNGNRVKASKIFKVYCRHLKLEYPDVDTSKLEYK